MRSLWRRRDRPATLRAVSSTPPHSRGPDPRWAVALELLRALWGVVLLPLHAFVFAFQRGTWRQGVRAALASQADTQRAFGDDDDGLDWSALPGPWFLSSAEPSGEIHALSFVRELESRGAAPQLIGFGGERPFGARVVVLCDVVVLALERSKLEHAPRVAGSRAEPLRPRVEEFGALIVRPCL